MKSSGLRFECTARNYALPTLLRENVSDYCRGGMVVTKCIHSNCKRTLKEHSRPPKVALVPKQDGKTIEARGC
jgi:hypothetical protein